MATSSSSPRKVAGGGPGRAAGGGGGGVVWRSGGAKKKEKSGAGSIVLPAEEWQRIRDSLGRREREREEQRIAQQSREDRRLQSQKIVKNWENTIEGQRLKKLQARKLREEEEEERNREIDDREAEYQAQCRREAIERAKTLLYHQTDRVKTFHRALILSEVIRERDSQLEYKKKREGMAKEVDLMYLNLQQEEREKGVTADHQAALKRAEARNETAKFHITQITEKKREREKRREDDLAEQKRLDKAMEIFSKTEEEALTRRKDCQVKFRAELDDGVRDCMEREKKKQQEDATYDAGIKIFQEAKRRMARLRKEKEKELFQQFQKEQEKMADNLQSQRLQERSIEDEMVAKAMEEQYAKKERAEEEKQRLCMERTRDIHRHTMEMMAEKEQEMKEEQEADRELLRQRKEHDLQFHQTQQEKAQRNFHDARDLQSFLWGQAAEKRAVREEEERDDHEYSHRNQQLLEVERRQLRQYADEVITEAKARGGPTQLMEKAALAGAGGGKGPPITAGLQPSYKAADATAVELPNYQSQTSSTPANTQRRIGFTW